MTEIFEDSLFLRRGRGFGFLFDICFLTESVTRQPQPVNDINNFPRIHFCILVINIAFAERKIDLSGQAVGKCLSASIREQQIFLAVFSSYGIIVFDETSGAPNKEKTHQFVPVIGKRTLLKCSQCVFVGLMLCLKFRNPADTFDIALRRNTEIGFFRNKKSQLIAEIVIGFVIRCCRKQNDLALVL